MTKPDQDDTYMETCLECQKKYWEEDGITKTVNHVTQYFCGENCADTHSLNALRKAGL